MGFLASTYSVLRSAMPHRSVAGSYVKLLISMLLAIEAILRSNFRTEKLEYRPTAYYEKIGHVQPALKPDFCLLSKPCFTISRNRTDMSSFASLLASDVSCTCRSAYKRITRARVENNTCNTAEWRTRVALTSFTLRFSGHESVLVLAPHTWLPQYQRQAAPILRNAIKNFLFIFDDMYQHLIRWSLA